MSKESYKQKEIIEKSNQKDTAIVICENGNLLGGEDEIIKRWKEDFTELLKGN